MEVKGQPKSLSADPAEGCALPKVKYREMKSLSVEQFHSFLREAREIGVFELYYLELTTGLRREAAGVKEEVGRGGGREEEAGVYLWLQNLWIWTEF